MGAVRPKAMYGGKETTKSRLWRLIDEDKIDQYTMAELSEMLGATKGTIRVYRDQWSPYGGSLDNIVEPDRLPLITNSGTKMAHCKGRKWCNLCAYEDDCRAAVNAGDYAFCELPLESELVTLTEYANLKHLTK